MANRIHKVINAKGLQSLMPNEKELRELRATKTKWSRWVSGTDDPDFWQVPIIARIIGCSIEELFPEVDEFKADENLIGKHSLVKQ